MRGSAEGEARPSEEKEYGPEAGGEQLSSENKEAYECHGCLVSKSE
jgi:hypothetical protein